MLRFFRRGATGPLHHLRKDAATPHGTIWSCFATPGDLMEVADGEIADTEHRFRVGDIINMRPPNGGRRAVMRLRVKERHDGHVIVERVRNGSAG